MYNKVELCGVNTSRLRVLTNDEIYALLRRLRAGDLSARDELVCGNLRLVLSVIQRFANRGEMLDDLFQVGCIGLIKSIDNFNLELDVKFSTYAVPMIIGEVRRYLRDHSMVRVSRSLRDLAYRAMQARERFMAENAREPSVDELARLTGAGREEIVFALDAVTDPVSLYEPLYSDGTDAICVMDQVRDTRSTDENWLEQIALDDAIGKLSERERRILRLRFYEGKTQMEVAGAIGISQAQVSRVEKAALAKMKKQL
ncbi:MAG: RNA polymerase sporulation sigma factor SigG [Clostridiaceae bacterium]|nr:RNA polymerase sporulation sigma factor SigG [Clostridiaceae bacterium]MDY3284973.1 RNA polymerase sporulation sigma factor SigG [Eubacteriales bacterium]MDY5015853.1 RNA polymerase sporulation sigma factor SigG [Eubacteriales bacterium]